MHFQFSYKWCFSFLLKCTLYLNCLPPASLAIRNGLPAGWAEWQLLNGGNGWLCSCGGAGIPGRFYSICHWLPPSWQCPNAPHTQSNKNDSIKTLTCETTDACKNHWGRGTLGRECAGLPRCSSLTKTLFNSGGSNYEYLYKSRGELVTFAPELGEPL